MAVVETDAGAEDRTCDGGQLPRLPGGESSLLILGGLVCYLREYLFLWEESHRFLSPERAWEEQAESSAHSAFLWCRFGMRSPG